MADPDAATDLPARLDALRASGAAERAPIRFAYIEALVRRAVTQAPAIRRALAARIDAAASELASRPAAPPAEISLNSSGPNSGASPLAELLAYIGQHAHAQPGAAKPSTGHPAVNYALKEAPLWGKIGPKPKAVSTGHSPPAQELKSVAYFRNEWSKLSTEQQLTQTLAQAPENAGPMNSQHLVLRSLQTMRDIAPEYLQAFMSYIDTLIWLEHADPTRTATGRSSGGEGENRTRSAKRGAKGR